MCGGGGGSVSGLCSPHLSLVNLRIDNSRRGRIHSLWDISRTTRATTLCDISNERADFSACDDISGFEEKSN